MGPINNVMYLYATESLEAYEKALVKLHEDPEMKPVSEVLFQIYSDSERWLLKPTGYSPLQ